MLFAHLDNGHSDTPHMLPIMRWDSTGQGEDRCKERQQQRGRSGLRRRSF